MKCKAKIDCSLPFLTQVCNTAIQRFELDNYADKTVKTYSGGTKRKLSVALALLGEPDLILLVCI